MRVDLARQMRVAAVLSAQGATNAQALSMPTLYKPWAPKTPYGGEGEDKIVSRPGGLYRCRQPHTSQDGWEPENYPAGWEHIDVEHSGTMEDPIPAVRNMEYFKGKYYLENKAIYLCIRDSEMAVNYLPSELVGTYFETVEAAE